MPTTKPYDIFIIGGGINGAGIARDASGRGYKTALAEMEDFASATSSSSTKLFHGGLRYLEFFEFKLVRKALIEREVLLKAMPHISWPMRFVLPTYPEMRFENDTPTSRVLSRIMPWMKGRRPAWLIRLGLFLYDNMAKRSKALPGTSRLKLDTAPEGAFLHDKYRHAFEYSDCWVEDARLTLLNVKDAEQKGADIFARTKVTSAEQIDGLWHIELQDKNGKISKYTARMIVNAAGPWVEDVIQNVARLNTKEGVRLVRGSHIITKKLFDHDKCYFFQGTDGRIMFAIPYEEDFTLMGTTDAEHDDAWNDPECSDQEIDYMIDFMNNYFKKPISRDDIVWTYSGVRPLYDDGASSATAATRSYVLRLNTSAGAPVLNIFGGKITTFRKLAEAALDEIDTVFSKKTKKWTAAASLPGGDIKLEQIDNLRAELQGQMPFLDGFTIRRLVRQYGTQCRDIFKGVDDEQKLGKNFGHFITALEIDWAIENEWVACADDFLWRRSKMGLRLSKAQVKALDSYIKKAAKASS